MHTTIYRYLTRLRSHFLDLICSVRLATVSKTLLLLSIVSSAGVGARVVEDLVHTALRLIPTEKLGLARRRMVDAGSYSACRRVYS